MLILQVYDWQYNNPRLTWSTDYGNDYNVELTFYMPVSKGNSDDVPHFAGKLWKKDEKKPSEDNWIGDQTPPPDPASQSPHVSPWTWDNIAFAIALGFIQAGILEAVKMVWKSLARLWNDKRRHASEEVIEKDKAE